LEDNFGTSFAGKYESFFCPNQGTPEENLHALTQAISQVYASGLNPDALLYRRSKGLQDYDERLAILIQTVEGERFGKYFLPHAAGVAFSRNLFRWDPQIRQEDGFIRLVWGLGTRAVDRVGQDYPRLIALSHPELRPESSPKDILRYSQRYVDLLDLEANAFRTLPIANVLTPEYPPVRMLAYIDRGGYLTPIRSNIIEEEPEQLVLTFDGLIRRTPFADRMKRILKHLEKHYQRPVDVEFALYLTNLRNPQPEVHISLLQCRPQSRNESIETQIPENLDEESVIFSTRRMVPQGLVQGIRFVLFVPPQAYYALPTAADRSKIGRAIGRINAVLSDKNFICVGPGRWGTVNPDLGVHVGYGDIYNTRALIELAGKDATVTPDPSFGTHFFQDLVEANIYPLAVYLSDQGVVFNHAFFQDTPNRLAKLFPGEANLSGCLKLIDVEDYRPGHHIEIVMNNEERQAIAFIKPNDPRAAIRTAQQPTKETHHHDK